MGKKWGHKKTMSGRTGSPMAWYEEEHYEAPVSESLFHPERLEHLRCHQILRSDYPRTYRRTEGLAPGTGYACTAGFRYSQRVPSGYPRVPSGSLLLPFGYLRVLRVPSGYLRVPSGYSSTQSSQISQFAFLRVHWLPPWKASAPPPWGTALRSEARRLRV